MLGHQEATSALRRALEVRSTCVAEDDYESAFILRYLGEALLQSGSLEESIAVLERSLRVLRDTPGHTGLPAAAEKLLAQARQARDQR